MVVVRGWSVFVRTARAIWTGGCTCGKEVLQGYIGTRDATRAFSNWWGRATRRGLNQASLARRYYGGRDNHFAQFLCTSGLCRIARSVLTVSRTYALLTSHSLGRGCELRFRCLSANVLPPSRNGLSFLPSKAPSLYRHPSKLADDGKVSA